MASRLYPEYVTTLIDDANPGKVFRKDRVKLAYQILGGVPSHAIELQTFFYEMPQDFCSTIACGGGWLSLHPQFQAFGLSPDRGKVHCSIKFEVPGLEITGDEFEALDEVFCVPGLPQGRFRGERFRGESLSVLLFSFRNGSVWDEALARQYLEHFGMKNKVKNSGVNLLYESKSVIPDSELLLMRLKHAYHHHSI